MTASEKRLAWRTGALGLVLTAIALLADMSGLLAPLEHWLYDQRTRHCQFFAPPPTDDLVYVDIDDQSIDAIGSFFFRGGEAFIGGDRPSIADIRLAASLEFLAAIDYPLPDWATRFMPAIESTLDTAYSEPAADVRGFIASVKAPVG